MIRNCNLCGLQYEVADRNCGDYRANFCSESCRDLFLSKFDKKVSEHLDDILPDDHDRFCVSMTIFDNETGELLTNEGFNTASLENSIISLETTLEKLKERLID